MAIRVMKTTYTLAVLGMLLHLCTVTAATNSATNDNYPGFLAMEDRRLPQTNEIKKPWTFGFGMGPVIGTFYAFAPSSIVAGYAVNLRFVSFMNTEPLSAFYLQYTVSYRTLTGISNAKYDLMSYDGAEIGLQFPRTIDLLSFPTAAKIAFSFFHYFPNFTANSHLPGYALRIPFGIDTHIIPGIFAADAYVAPGLFLHRPVASGITSSMQYNFFIDAGFSLWIYLY
ncbi:MAG: hypothetical protein HZC28_09220 [Spirochaetes bacterium]|nr:hypothetical protein [Spirochaetota bacterium]